MRVAIAGASGRMGRTLIEAVLAAPDMQLAGALDAPEVTSVGQDAGAFAGQRTGVTVTTDIAHALANAQVLVDFTRPEGTLQHLDVAMQMGCAMVIGTTGFDVQGHAAIRAASNSIPIVFAPNMGVGMNITLKLLELAARHLVNGFDVEILEAHHGRKIDAPSGTALAMGRTIAAAQGKSLEDVATWARHGVTGERPAGSIGFAVVRGGDLVGEHTALFLGTGERIEISHKSSSRATYADGSLRAARFLTGHTSGLFDMQDVLGLR